MIYINDRITQDQDCVILEDEQYIFENPYSHKYEHLSGKEVLEALTNPRWLMAAHARTLQNFLMWGNATINPRVK